MSFNRRGESGNVFFTLFGAVALVGVIGVATTTLMKGPVGTVVTLNQKAKIESQLQIARKLVALDAAQRSAPDPDCDGDGTIEPMNPDITGNCATLITGGGCLPIVTGAAKIDPWGTQVGYCAWDHATQGGSADQWDGTHIGCTPPANTRQLLQGEVGVSNQPVLAVISAGANRTFETVCNIGGPLNTDYAFKPGGSDDIVFEWTYEEAATGVGGGLWSLMSGTDAITTDNDVEFTRDATFSSGTSATFADQSSAAFNTGSVLDLTGGGLFRLPDQTTSGPCGAANESMLRIDTTAGQVLQICDPTAAPNWTDIGGSGASSSVAGSPGDIQFNSGGALWADSDFQWDVGNSRLLIGSPATANDTVEIDGTVGISSDLNVQGIVEVNAGSASDPAFTFTSANNTGLFLDAGGDVGISVGGSQIVDVTSASVDVNGDLNTTNDVNVGNILYVSSDAFIDNNLDVGGIVFNSNGDLTIGDVLSVTSAAKFATNGHFGGAVNATRFLVDGSLNAGAIVDGNDGLESDGAGGIGLLTAGTRRMHIDSAGDIGIGVTGAPTATLDINGMLRLRNNASIESGDTCTAQDGSIVYGSGDRLLICSSMTGFWETIGATGGGGGGTVGLWERAFGAIQPIEGHGVDDFAFGNQQPETSGTFMFFDKSKGAFRVGSTAGSEWTDANRGTNSIAMGADALASGDYSVSLGRDADATAASSFAFGLGASSGASPEVSAANSFGIFMGDQAGVDLTTANVMLLAGGRLVIDPDTTSATEIAPTNGLTVDVEGSVGAMNFCNEDGTECFTAGDIASGATGAPGGNRQVLYNSNGDMFADPGLIFSSTGGLGLNVADTATRLDVGGTMKMAYDGEACDATREGGIHYNSSNDTFYVCRTAGQPWQAVAAGAAAAAGNSREVQFNSGGYLDTLNGFVMSSTGRLGVMENTPLAYLHVGETDGVGGSAPSFLLARNTDEPYMMFIDDGSDSSVLGIATDDYFTMASEDSQSGIRFRVNGDYGQEYINNAPIAMTIGSDGRVAVGTGTANTKLDVDGTMKMAYDGEACDATREGGIHYNSSTDTFYVCRTAGQPWQALAAGASTAAGNNRELQFNSGGLLDAMAGFVIDANGLVGLGTATPATPLHLATSGTSARSIAVEGHEDYSSDLALLTAGDNASAVGTAATRGWIVTARGTNFATPVAQDDMIYYFWDGATYQQRLWFAHDTGNLALGDTWFDEGTKLAVEGTIKMAFGGEPCDAAREGSISYNSALDRFRVCQTAGGGWVDIATGNITTAAPDRGIQFNSGGGLAADAGLVFSSTGDLLLSGTYTGTASVPVSGAGTRMFFDVQTGAVRAGTTSAAHFDNAQIGNNSAAFGENVRASGANSFAAGLGTLASGTASVAIGNAAVASGNYGYAIGNNVSAGQHGVAIGRTVNVTGQYSAGWGVGNAVGVAPIVSGNSILGVFMGDQSGVTVSTNNTMAILGGGVVIDPRAPALNLSADTALEIEGSAKLAYGGEACDATREGGIHYNSSDDTFYVCRTAGQPWQALAAGTAAAAGLNREIQYNSGGTFGSNPNFVFGSSGTLGIGTPTPSFDLHISRTSQAALRIEGDGTFNDVIWSVSSLDTGDIWQWDLRGSSAGDYGNYNLNRYDGATTSWANMMSFREDGRMGVGKTNPMTLLDVAGTLRIDYDAEACDASREGGIHYNSSDDTFYVCRTAGQPWQALAAGAATAGGSDRQMQFNSGGLLAGTANLVYNSAGNMGLGRSTASARLHLETPTGGLGTNFTAPIAAASALRITEAANEIYMDGNSIVNVGSNLHLGTSGVFDLIVRTSGVERMRIDETGTIGIGTNLPGTLLDVAGSMKMAYGGEACDATREGGIHYNSSDDTFYVCRTAGAWTPLATGTPSAATPDRGIQFNSGGSFAASSDFIFTSSGDFIVGTSQLDYVSTKNSLMFFDATQSAIRAGYIDSGAYWNAADRGFASAAFGYNTRGRGASSFAAGSFSLADGYASIAMGNNTEATGNSSIAIGDSIESFGDQSVALGWSIVASGDNSIGLGRQVDIGDGVANSGVGDFSMGIGLGNIGGTHARITGDSSLGIFMGAQTGGVTLADSNTMLLAGGRMVIDPRIPATNLSADTAFEVEGTMKMAYGGEACDATREGGIHYNSSDDTFYVCRTAGAWTPLATGTLAAAAPSRGIQFNSGGTFAADSMLTFSTNGQLQIGGGLVLAGGLTPPQITANTNDYAPANFDTAQSLRLSTDASRDLTGIAGGTVGRLLTIINVGSNPLVLRNDTTSTAANRFLLGADLTLAANQSITVVYDAASSRWRPISSVSAGGVGSAIRFTSLTDAPASYSGQALRVVRVNAAATGVEFTNNVIETVGGIPAPTGFNLDDLNDVNAAAPTDGYCLKYTSASGLWESGDCDGAGAGPWTINGNDIYYNSSGTPRVGIGNAAPTQALDVTGTVRASVGLQLGLTAGAAAPTYLTLDGISDVNATSPTAGHVLTYSGGSWIASAPTGGSGGGFWTAGAGDDIYYNSGTAQVGIGNANPTEALDVTGNVKLSGGLQLGLMTGVAAPATLSLNDLFDVTAPSPSAGQVLLYSGGAWIPGTASGSASASGSSRQVQFNSGGALAANTNFVYTTTGRLGIGNAAPTEALHVTGNLRVTQALKLDGVAGAAAPAGLALDDLTNVNAGSPGAGQVLLYSGGAWVAGTASGGSASPGGANRQIQFNSNGTLEADTNLVYTATGRVGIGNAAPTEALDVTGTVRASQSFQLGLVAGAAAPSVMNLDDLGNVDASSPSAGHVLTYSGGNWISAAGGGGGGGSFIGLTDVPAAFTGGAGQFVKVNTAEDALEFSSQIFPIVSGQPAPYGIMLSGLDDVSVASVNDGEVLMYSAGLGQWVPGVGGGGGGADLWTAGTGDDIYYNSGTAQVGIGNSSPVEALDVTGTVRISEGIQLLAVTGAASPTQISLDDLQGVSVTSPTAGHVLTYSGGSWISAAASGGATAAGSGREIQFRSGSGLGADANFNYTATGRLGLGIASPSDMLHLGDGNLRIDGTAGAQAGCMRFNDATDRLEYSNDCSTFTPIDNVAYSSTGGGSGDLVGTLTYAGAANCVWNTTGATFARYLTPDADCASASVTGSASAPTEGKIPAIRFASLPAGSYEVTFNSQFYTSAGGVSCRYRISTGAVNSGILTITSDSDPNLLSGVFTFGTAQTDITFYIDAMKLSGTGSCGVYADEAGILPLYVYVKSLASGSGGGSATPAGADRQIQFNSGGAFAASSGLVFTSAGDLHITAYDQNISNTARELGSFYMEIAPTGAQAAGKVSDGLFGGIGIVSGNTQQIRKARGLVGYAANDGTGAIEALEGSAMYAANRANANVDAISGQWAGATSMLGNVGNMYAMIAEANVSGGTVANAYGLVVNQLNTGGTITNRYGIYMSAPSGSATNDWGIYQAGTQLNYLGGGLALGNDVSPAIIGANQNDYAPTGHATASVLRLSASGAYNITGLAGGVDGRIVTVTNVGGNAITLANENASSLAANRFALSTDVTLAANQSAVLVYDATSARWRAMSVYGPVGAATASGSDRQIQFNSAGSFATSPNFYFTSFGRLHLEATVATDNIFIGNNTGNSTMTGNNNTILGDLSTQSVITTGGNNVTIGRDAGRQLSSGTSNVMIGYSAGESVSTAFSNTFVGAYAGQVSTGGSNTYIGFQAGTLNVSGGQNTYLGYEAGENSTANGSTLLGYRAGKEMTTASRNNYIGAGAGQYTVSGGRNTALGYEALQYNVSGNDNVAIGEQAAQGALGLTDVVSNNVTIGARSGVNFRSGSNGNTLIGHETGATLQTGTDNILIGRSADVPAAGTSNYLNIGSLLYGDTLNNRFGVEATSPNATLDVNGSVAFSNDVSPASIGASQNDYAPTGHATASVLRLTASGAYNITGLAGGVDGRILTIVNIGTGAITLVDESASSVAANRFALAGSITLTQDQSAVLLYDSGSSRWRAMAVYGPGGAAVAGGADREIQFNNAGALGGISNFDYNADGTLEYWAQRTDTAGTALKHSNFFMNVAPTAAQTVNSRTTALSGEIYIPNTNTYQIRSVKGLNSYADNQGTGAIESLMASQAYAYSSAGAVTSFFGTYSGAEIAGGSATNIYGVTADGRVTAGTVTSISGLHVTLSQTAGTITNRHGVYLASPTGTATNDWGIYQAGTQMNRLGGGLALANDVSPASIGASQNDYAPTGHATASVLRLTASGAYNITGLAGGMDGRILTVTNIGSNAITLVNESASSVAGNRFAIGSNIALAASQSAVLMYDSSSARWRAMSVYGGGGSATAGGADREIQFNSGGTFAGSSAFVFNSAGQLGLGNTPGSSTRLSVGNFTDWAPMAWKRGGSFYAGSGGSSASYNGTVGLESTAETQATGAGASEAYGIVADGQTTNDAKSQVAVGIVGGTLIHNTDVGYSLYASDNNSSTGGTSYGVYINLDDADTTRWGIYQTTANNNRLNGNLGIGVDPSVALDINGSIEYTGTITDVSDMRLKTDILPLRNEGSMLEKVGMIDTYTFRMKDDMKRREYGVMAQELEKVFPELVHTADDEMGTKSVNYVGLIAPMIEATKELKAENDNLRAEIAALRAERDEFKTALNDLATDVKGLKAHTGYGINRAEMGLWMLLIALASGSLVLLLGGIVRNRQNKAE